MDEENASEDDHAAEAREENGRGYRHRLKSGCGNHERRDDGRYADNGEQYSERRSNGAFGFSHFCKPTVPWR
jgi:hypothetical protein